MVKNKQGAQQGTEGAGERESRLICDQARPMREITLRSIRSVFKSAPAIHAPETRAFPNRRAPMTQASANTSCFPCHFFTTSLHPPSSAGQSFPSSQAVHVKSAVIQTSQDSLLPWVHTPSVAQIAVAIISMMICLLVLRATESSIQAPTLDSE